jgi:hypothetical protein
MAPGPESNPASNRSEPRRPQVGDGVELRKPHACGGREWNVTRIGADIGLECRTCLRRVLLPRADLDRRVRRYL